MQNIKNFKLVNATPELLAEFNNNTSVLFLESEDGQGWYAAQKLFADDTVKIQYDSNGVITAVVDAPVPQRGNIYAVSMLWPVNASVAEIAVADYPAGVAIEGTWKFDEETQTVYQDSAAVDAATLAANTRLRNQYAADAALNIATLQAGITINRSVVGDSDALTAWRGYLCDLRDMTAEQLQQSPAAFPTQPDFVI